MPTIKKEKAIVKKVAKKSTKKSFDKKDEFLEILNSIGNIQNEKYDNKNINNDKQMIEEQCKKLLIKLIHRNNTSLMRAIDNAIYDNYEDFNKLSKKNISFENKLKTIVEKVSEEIVKNNK